MTLLVLSIPVRTMESVEALHVHGEFGGADAVELRIDHYQGDLSLLAEYLRKHAHVTWIVTSRTDLAAMNRSFEAARLHAKYHTVVDYQPVWVDFDLSDWDALSKTQQETWQPKNGPSARPRLILSRHDFERLPDDLCESIPKVLTMQRPDAAKVAYQPTEIVNSFAALDLMKEHGSRVSSICMDEEGIWTRILARKFDAFASYCSLSSNKSTAPGQLTLREMNHLYRWRTIDRSTKVFGVLGDPVGHSMGPALFNSWFESAGINAVYVPLRVRGPAIFPRFLQECLNRSWLDLGGFSVTVPHKAAALEWLGDRADRMAQSIGAVNTLALRDGTVAGYNTDCYALMGSLVDALGCSARDLRGVPIDVLGTGGAARATLSGLSDVGARLTVYGRSPRTLDPLAQTFGAMPAAWEQLGKRTGEILINCTPIGMWPDLAESPIPAGGFGGCKLVFDLIYNPIQTKLLRLAALAGVRTSNGLDMFLRQAALQFELWTGRTPDLNWGEAVVRARLLGMAGGDDKPAKPIALIGMRGTGKSSVGRPLAKILAGDFVDTDELVSSRAGKSITSIFAEDGESGFRLRESAAIAEAVARSPCVISVGGGAVVVPRNIEFLRENCTVVWLTASLDRIRERIVSDPMSATMRPPLTGPDPIRELEKLARDREPHYSAAAHLGLDTSRLLAIEAAFEIVRLLANPTRE